MQTMIRAVLAAGLFACVVFSTVQTVSAKKGGGTACAISNGTCVTLHCIGGCGPLPPATCTCVGQ